MLKFSRKGRPSSQAAPRGEDKPAGKPAPFDLLFDGPEQYLSNPVDPFFFGSPELPERAPGGQQQGEQQPRRSPRGVGREAAERGGPSPAKQPAAQPSSASPAKPATKRAAGSPAKQPAAPGSQASDASPQPAAQVASPLLKRKREPSASGRGGQLRGQEQGGNQRQTEEGARRKESQEALPASKRQRTERPQHKQSPGAATADTAAHRQQRQQQQRRQAPCSERSRPGQQPEAGVTEAAGPAASPHEASPQGRRQQPQQRARQSGRTQQRPSPAKRGAAGADPAAEGPVEEAVPAAALAAPPARKQEAARRMGDTAGQQPQPQLQQAGQGTGVEDATEAAAPLAARGGLGPLPPLGAPKASGRGRLAAAAAGARRSSKGVTAAAAGTPSPPGAGPPAGGGGSSGTDAGLSASLPAAMARLLRPGAAVAGAGAGVRDAAAATTEAGEQQQYVDSAWFAMDGLASSAPRTRQSSMVALAEVCASRRGRLAMRSSGCAAEVVDAAAKLDVGGDPLLALGVATLLLCLCQSDADPQARGGGRRGHSWPLLSRPSAARVAAALLQTGSDVVAGGAAPGSDAGRLTRVLGDGALARHLPPEERACPLSVCLVAMAGELPGAPLGSARWRRRGCSRPTAALAAAPRRPPRMCAPNAQPHPCMQGLREAGALDRALEVAVEAAPALTERSPTLDTVRCLWRLHRSLLLLENACFACPANEAHLVAATVRQGLPPLVVQGSAVGWLVQRVGELGRQGLLPGLKKDCLRAMLAVLMNCTQSNPAGCERVVAEGGLEAAAPLLAQMVAGGPKLRGAAHSREELTAWVDELSACLGLLINLTEHSAGERRRAGVAVLAREGLVARATAESAQFAGDPCSPPARPSRPSAPADWRRRLRVLPLPPVPGAAAGAVAAPPRLLPLLCQLLRAVIPPARFALSPLPHAPTLGADAAAAGGADGKRHASGEGEVTLDALSGEEEQGAASIVEVYAAILLGFLVEGSPDARREAAALLPTHSLAPVAAAVARCFHFYLSAGAMTKGSEDSLRRLLASLQEDGGGGAGGGGAAAQQEQAQAASG
eukprot:scaffold11.g3842.t1